MPALNQGGWYDGFIPRDAAQLRGDARARRDPNCLGRSEHLIVGPWLHQPLPDPSAGNGYFGPSASGAAIDWHGMQLAWFDRWLRDEDNGVDTDPSAYLFVMGREPLEGRGGLASAGC